MTTADSAAVTDHLAQAEERLDRARRHLADGRLHKASRKGWSAAEHMAKAVAEAQGWEYERHADFSVVLNHARRLTDNARLGDLRAPPTTCTATTTGASGTSTPRSSARTSRKWRNCWRLLAPLTQPTR